MSKKKKKKVTHLIKFNAFDIKLISNIIKYQKWKKYGNQIKSNIKFYENTTIKSNQKSK